jgi:RNA polymerase sigma-70 factor (ECF subfamily)
MREAPKDLSALVSAAHAGSNSALGEVLETCRRYLLLVAERELNPDLRAKAGPSDLVQQTFLEAQRDFGQFRGNSESELRAWLLHLLRHNLGKCARQYRHTQKRQLDREVSLSRDDSGRAPCAGLAADTPSPSGHAMEREQDEALERALARLPEDHRRVIELRYREERSFEEIGVLMQRSADAARKLWARAVERLQQELEGPDGLR